MNRKRLAFATPRWLVTVLALLLLLGFGPNTSGASTPPRTGPLPAETRISTQILPSRTGHQVVVFQGQLWLIGGVHDRPHNDIWSSSDGITWVQQTADADFTVRRDHQVAVFDDGSGEGEQLWLIGGYDGNEKNDVWSSSDGVTWVQQTAAANFTARYNHQVVVFDDGSGEGEQLWLIGGYDGNYKNDVWSSSDGVTWRQQTAAADFTVRRDAQVVVFDGGAGAGEQLWLVGGYDGDYKNDVWSSSDGVTWKQQTAAANFRARDNHQVVVFDDGSGPGEQLWLISADAGGSVKNNVWSSNDGVNWVEQSTVVDFPTRYLHQVVIFDDGSGERLWLIGGVDGNRQNDAWLSSDDSI